MTRTFWLSFVDPFGAEGQRFLGVCIVDVIEEEAEAEKRLLPKTALSGAEWVGAAARRAWRMRCNPGGQMNAYPLPTPTPFARDRLFSLEDLISMGMAPQQIPPKPPQPHMTDRDWELVWELLTRPVEEVVRAFPAYLKNHRRARRTPDELLASVMGRIIAAAISKLIREQRVPFES